VRAEEIEASDKLRDIRQNITLGDLSRAESQLTTILTYHQYTAAAWIEFATIKSLQGDYCEVIKAIQQVCLRCPLKSDLQTYADTIQMYLEAANLLQYQYHPITDQTMSSQPNIIITPIFLTSTVSPTSVSSDRMEIIPPFTSSETDSATITTKPPGDTATPPSSLKPTATSTTTPIAYTITIDACIENLWLKIRALLRAINVAIVTGIKIHPRSPATSLAHLYFHTNKPSPLESPPYISFTSNHEYLRSLVCEVLYQLGHSLLQLFDLLTLLSCPNNCLESAYSFLMLSVLTDQSNNLQYQEMLSLSKAKLHDNEIIVP
jgi:hypothetical protein